MKAQLIVIRLPYGLLLIELKLNIAILTFSFAFHNKLLLAIIKIYLRLFEMDSSFLLNIYILINAAEGKQYVGNKAKQHTAEIICMMLIKAGLFHNDFQMVIPVLQRMGNINGMRCPDAFHLAYRNRIHKNTACTADALHVQLIAA